MTEKKNLIKQIVKKNEATPRTFGTDPRDPWSVKYNVSEEVLDETALLNRYLKSRGISPEFASKDQKVAHSKTNAFKVWMRAHIKDTVGEETLTTEPSPTRKRLAVLKTSVHKHKEIRDPDGHKKLHSEESLDEISLGDYKEKATQQTKELKKHTSGEYGDIAKRMLDRREKGLKRASVRESLGDDFTDMLKSKGIKHRVHGSPEQEKQRTSDKMADNKAKADSLPKPKVDKDTFGSRRGYGQGRYMGDSVEVEGQPIEEVSSELLSRYKEKAKQSADTLTSTGQHKKATDRHMNVMKATGKQMSKTLAGIKKSLNREESTLEAGAACNQPWDGGNSPDDVIPAKKSGAKLVKSIVKKHVKEDMYDHEKEDKSVAGLKKPKFQKTDTDTVTKERPEAAAVLKGGKTLTGEPRDTIEIDPMMKVRKKTEDSQSQKND